MDWWMIRAGLEAPDPPGGSRSAPPAPIHRGSVGKVPFFMTPAVGTKVPRGILPLRLCQLQRAGGNLPRFPGAGICPQLGSGALSFRGSPPMEADDRDRKRLNLRPP